MRPIRNVLLTWALVIVMGTSGFADQRIKQPNVAYQFYAGDPQQLSSHIAHLMERAEIQPFDTHVNVMIAPHAGHVYSGLVAAYGFKAASRNSYKTVIILAPSHHYNFDGVSVWSKGAFKTPLGKILIDEEMASKIMAIDEKVFDDPKIYDKEHSVEVEIPFIQTVFKEAKIVPLIFGFPSASIVSKIAKGLDHIIGDRQDVLIIVSSDMSHYYDDAKARKLDERGIRAIQKYDVEDIIRNNNKTMAIDGVLPMITAILYAKNKGLKYADVLKYSHSGHINGDMKRVVGYVSMVFHNKTPFKNGVVVEKELTLIQKKRLIEIARTTIDMYITKGEKYKVKEKDPRLREDTHGAFVTIHKKGELRGCIGHIIGTGPLAELVRDMAIQAATNDPRFNKVSKEELSEIDVEVSVLSQPRRIASIDDIELGKHGVILSQGVHHRGVFLPQVATETGWDKHKFLSVLSSQKAGLPPDAWQDQNTILQVFTAEVFSESDVR